MPLAAGNRNTSREPLPAAGKHLHALASSHLSRSLLLAHSSLTMRNLIEHFTLRTMDSYERSRALQWICRSTC